MKKHGMTVVMLTGFVCLAIVTAGAAFWIERYEQTGPELLGENWEMTNPDAGRADPEKGVWRLASENPEQSVRLLQAIDSWGGHNRLCLSADLRWEGVVAGEKNWHRARLVLSQYDAAGKWMSEPHEAAGGLGSRGWRRYEKVFEISPRARHLKAVAGLTRCTGEFWMKNAELHAVSQTAAYCRAAKVLVGAWAVFFLVLLGGCMAGLRHGPFLLKAALVLCFLAILAGTTMPVETKNQIKHGVEDQIQSVGKNAGAGDLADKISVDITKVGHFVLFAAAGLVLVFLMRRARYFEIFAILLMLAGGTELVQFFIDGRTPLATDFLIDAAGGTAGVVIGGRRNRGNRGTVY